MQENQSILTFRAAETPCALSTEHVIEIVPMARLSRPPGLPTFVEGILNLGGEAVPVIGLSQLLDLPKSALGAGSLLIITRIEDQVLGFAVDKVDDVRPVRAFTEYRECDVFNGCVQGELVLDGVCYHLLRASAALLKEERLRLKEFREKEQRRLNDLEVGLPG